MGKHARVFFTTLCLLVLFLSTLLQSLPAQVIFAASSERNLMRFSPSEMVSRAREWVAPKEIKYATDTQPGDRFQNYRADCSGLITMAWGIPAGATPNDGLFTGNNPHDPNQQYALSSVADLLGKALDDAGKPIMSTMLQLQPGDILLNQSGDLHAILFVSWISIQEDRNTHTQQEGLANKPVPYNGIYYYDGIEENYGYGYAVEHTPQYPVNAPKFDFHQPWPFPYDPGYDPGGYYAWRFDPAKASALGYSGQNASITPPPSQTATTKPGGMWMSPPSPTNGDMVSDVLHLAAQAYPTHQGDPAISFVNFTVGSQGSWKIACLVSPPATGDIFACDVHLQSLGISYGEIQVSFDVYDQVGNVNLAPNGVHTLLYVPSPGVAPTPTPTPIPTPPAIPTPGPTPTPAPLPTPHPTVTTDCGHLVTPWVAIYQYANFGGQELCFEGTGLINLADFGFDKQTMSINIAANGTFFDQPDGQGNQLAFYYGDEQADLGSWDDQISSFIVYN